MKIRLLTTLVLLSLLFLAGRNPAQAASVKKLEKPPLSDRWFGIYVDRERVGFYRQTITETPEGYQMEGEGSVRMKVMGFSKEATTREVYQVAKSMALRSLEVEQKINGNLSRLTGRISDTTLRLRNEHDGKVTDKSLKFKGELYPGPALNLLPLMKDGVAGKMYKISIFDPEELKIKEIKVNVLGEDKTPDGQVAIKLRNNLYPFVNNDIWIDRQGNTIMESVREGLVTTKVEDPKALAGFVSNVALSGKDLIYDFSLVRAEPPIRNQAALKGLVLEIIGWEESLPLPTNETQRMEKKEGGRVVVMTGSAQRPTPTPAATSAALPEALLPADRIEADAPEIIARARELSTGKETPEQTARALAGWTAEWLQDTVDDSGSALTSLKSRRGNCQSHARLYTALARAAGIPTRFVSGLVSLEGKGFLYHSWAESYLSNRWVSVDPTYNQLPADPTHIKLFEGHTPDDMAPIIAIIGKIRILVQEALY